MDLAFASTVSEDEDKPLTLPEYAELIGRSLRSVQRDVKAQRIPSWKDTTQPGSPMMTSLAAIRDVRAAAAAKALKEFKQRRKLG